MSRKYPKTAALTGGIASGKSTVARMFEAFGAYLIDADVVARQVVEPGQPAWREIVEHFGADILLENSQINRKKLGTIIFQQPEERQKLNHITHPRVIEQIDKKIEAMHQQPLESVIIVDVPLLIEADMHHAYDTIIVVYVPKRIQVSRLMTRDSITESEALRKIDAQMPLAEKVRYATDLVRNHESLAETREQVRKIYQGLS